MGNKKEGGVPATNAGFAILRPRKQEKFEKNGKAQERNRKF